MNKEQWNIVIDKEKTYERNRRQKAEGRRQKNSNESWYGIGLVGEIGFTIAFPILISIGIGSFLDKRLLTFPILTLIFLVIGLLISFLSVVKVVQEIINKNKS